MRFLNGKYIDKMIVNELSLFWFCIHSNNIFSKNYTNLKIYGPSWLNLEDLGAQQNMLRFN